MNVTILRADGTEQKVQLPFGQIGGAIGASAMDTVNLRDGRVMLVDDAGHAAAKPVNDRATRIYLALCRPGTTHRIVGDVAIVVDAEVGQ